MHIQCIEYKKRLRIQADFGVIILTYISISDGGGA